MALEGRKDEPPDEGIEEVADLETYAKAGKRPPKAKVYKFKVNDDVFEWTKESISAREALTLAGLAPPENFTVRLKLAGDKPEKVELDQVIDLRRPGLEKFRAIRKEQTDGEDMGRRDAPLLDADRAFLDSYGLAYDVVQDGSTWVILRDYPMPAGLVPEKTSVAIRLEQGYPYTGLDMAYMHPGVRRLDGYPIPQADVQQPIEGKVYQRWSRHRTGDNPWVPGQDSIESHVYLIEEWLAAEPSR